MKLLKKIGKIFLISLSIILFIVGLAVNPTVVLLFVIVIQLFFVIVGLARIYELL